MGGRSNTSAYAMKAMLLQMATMRRLTMSFMPNAANTKAEATNPIALLSVRIALCTTVALCVTLAGTITPLSSERDQRSKNGRWRFTSRSAFAKRAS
jgi:hypothetical protein